MGTGVRKPTGRPGPAGGGGETAHETTLPFVGRVVGHKTPRREGVDKSRRA